MYYLNESRSILWLFLLDEITDIKQKEQKKKEEYKLFVDSQIDEYQNRLSEVVLKLIEKYELELVGDRVVDHIMLDK
jgi:hypothetical protein